MLSLAPRDYVVDDLLDSLCVARVAFTQATQPNIVTPFDASGLYGVQRFKFCLKYSP
jgi:hypothetical protein